jgi:CRISPR-associated protein Cas6
MRPLDTIQIPEVFEVRFPVLGLSLPANNGYLLLGAVAEALGRGQSPYLRLFESLLSIGGGSAGDGVIRVNAQTFLTVRTPHPADWATALAGRVLGVSGHMIQLGLPEVSDLVPAAVLVSRLVTYSYTNPQVKRVEPGKGPTPQQVLKSLGRDLDWKGITGTPAIRTTPAGDPIRRSIKVKGRKIVGYSVEVSGLNDQASIRLQVLGLGGKRSMGCGVFVRRA